MRVRVLKIYLVLLSESEMLDDKSEHCIPFILDGLQRKFPHDTQRSPFFVGLNGAQGSGKTTLVSLIG